MSALAAQLNAAPRVLARVERIRPRYILFGLVVFAWVTTLGVAVTVRHNGWLYYQGGDELWHYTTAWVMGHGRLPHTSIGYAWSIVLLPFALVGGPNLVGPIPFIVLLNVLVLMPVALLATYGIGVRLGGRLFGYWVALLWILVPLIGIKYANAGYHQRYTEQLLPQSLGLTVMSDFPSMVASVVSAYFALRAVQDDDRWDGVMAGLVGGVALGIKPSNAPVLVGISLALLAARRWRSLSYTAAGIAPSILALAVWKARGEGSLPLFRSGIAGSHHLAAAAAPLLAIGLHSYVHLSWSFFTQQLDSIREHFWSVRVIEWLAIAGTIGLLRRSRPAGLLFGGWFFCVVVVKWMSPGHGSVDDSDLLRQTISAIPAFLVILAGVLLLVPGLPRHLRSPDSGRWGSHRIRVACVAAIGTVFCAVPLGLAAALPVLSTSEAISYYTQTGPSLNAPFTVENTWHPAVTRRGNAIRLSWNPLQPRGGTMGYRVLRAQVQQAVVCDTTGGGAQCRLNGAVVAATNGTSFTDHPGPGRWNYRIAAVASWIDDPTAGDIFVAGAPVDVTVPK